MISGRNGARHHCRASVPLPAVGWAGVIRILIADDHGVVRQGLQQIISEHMNMMVAGEAAAARRLSTSCAPMISMSPSSTSQCPGRGGLDILRDLKAAPARHESDRPEHVLRGAICGAHPSRRRFRLPHQDGAPDELVLAIETVAAGRRYITPSIADAWPATSRTPPPAPRTSSCRTARCRCLS